MRPLMRTLAKDQNPAAPAVKRIEEGRLEQVIAPSPAQLMAALGAKQKCDACVVDRRRRE